MSPHDMAKYRADFDAAAEIFVWEKREVEVPHEWDWASATTRVGWFNDEGVFLFYEGDISGGLVEEIITLSKCVS